LTSQSLSSQRTQLCKTQTDIGNGQAKVRNTLMLEMGNRSVQYAGVGNGQAEVRNKLLTASVSDAKI
jgi:hypothetical protein